MATLKPGDLVLDRDDPTGSVWRVVAVTDEVVIVSKESVAPATQARQQGATMTECWRPIGHEGCCGDPETVREDEDRILFGQCGAPPAPTGVLFARDGLFVSRQTQGSLALRLLTRPPQMNRQQRRGRR